MVGKIESGRNEVVYQLHPSTTSRQEASGLRSGCVRSLFDWRTKRRRTHPERRERILRPESNPDSSWIRLGSGSGFDPE
jgi:hypothetical protein